jgi:putative tributyrin esterase
MATFQIDFYSNALSGITPMTAILPIEIPENIPGIEIKERKEPFKTIYLLHGYSGSNNDWLNGSRIEFLARIFRVAVIMPAGRNSFYLDDEIKNEYYEKLVSEEIVEFSRKVFPLSDKREDTTIGGLSMGGYGAIRNGLKHSDVFGSIFAFSSALITDKTAQMKEGDGNPVMAPYSYYRHVFGDLDKLIGSDKDPKALAKRLVDTGADIPKIFMACGTEDFLLNENRSFHQCLLDMGIDHEYRESPGIHDWVFWDAYIEKAMEWLYGKPKLPNGQ